MRARVQVLLSGGASQSPDSWRQAFLIEKVVTSDDTSHIPTPFVRFTEGNESADIWASWRTYPSGGNTHPLPGGINGRGAAPRLDPNSTGVSVQLCAVAKMHPPTTPSSLILPCKRLRFVAVIHRRTYPLAEGTACVRGLSPV